MDHPGDNSFTKPSPLPGVKPVAITEVSSVEGREVGVGSEDPVQGGCAMQDLPWRQDAPL